MRTASIIPAQRNWEVTYQIRETNKSKLKKMQHNWSKADHLTIEVRATLDSVGLDATTILNTGGTDLLHQVVQLSSKFGCHRLCFQKTWSLCRAHGTSRREESSGRRGQWGGSRSHGRRVQRRSQFLVVRGAFIQRLVWKLENRVFTFMHQWSDLRREGITITFHKSKNAVDTIKENKGWNEKTIDSKEDLLTNMTLFRHSGWWWIRLCTNTTITTAKIQIERKRYHRLV